MARPKKPDLQKMTHVIPVRLTDVQHSIITENASAAGMSVADYIRRQAVHGKVKKEYRIVADFPKIQDLTRELSAIGNNLNQIARYFNSGGTQSKAIREEINSAMTQIMEIRNIALEMAGEFYGNTETHSK